MRPVKYDQCCLDEEMPVNSKNGVLLSCRAGGGQDQPQYENTRKKAAYFVW